MNPDSQVKNSKLAVVHPSLDQLARLQFEAKKISLLPRQPVSSLLSGRHASRLRGRGLMFEELRDYRPGDDIRAMDWKATARLRKPYVRVYSEERERPVLVVVDQRSTMFFGSARTTKATAAAEVAALAAWRTIDAGDRIGAIIFGDEEIVEIKPQRSRKNVLRICHELTRLNSSLSAESQSADSTTLNDALRRAVNVARHDHLVVLITDYHGDDVETRKLATRLVVHNDVIAVLVYDPLGASFPTAINMDATDGWQRLSIPSDKQFPEKFKTQFEKRLNQLRENLKSLRVPILPISTHESVSEQVLAAFGHHS